MVSVFSGKSDEEKAKELISWFLPDKKPEKKPDEEDTSEEQESDDEGVSGEGNLVTIVNSNDFLTLKGIKCYDHNGDVFENYDELIVAKDVVRHPAERYSKKNHLLKHVGFTPYKAITYFDNQKSGLFLPSFALLCNMVVALYVQKDSDSEVMKVLDQFKDYGGGFGWHNTNTVVDWGGKRIVHYPCDGDFPEHGGVEGINKSRQRREFVFDNKGFNDLVLGDALKISNYADYLRDLSGLKNPGRLVEVADYFGRTARSWISTGKKTRGAWLGCGSVDFDLFAYYFLGFDGAARGVGAGGTKKKVI